MNGLRIAPKLTLPMEFATEGVAVTGMRGSGKSNTQVRFVELLYEAGIPFTVIDPKGDWSGIRSSADGKSPGLSVPVFGGLHGDFPLEPEMGARIADLLVDEMISAVLDVSGMSKTVALPKFLTAFCNQLMERHRRDPHVRTVILEEAHRYIPQTVSGKVAEMKEAAAALLLEGRAFGLGCWAATQRPARLHKDVLEECGNLIIHRVGVASTHDKSTIAGWVEHHDISGEIVDSLTTLKPGEAWVLIPDDGIVQRVQMDRRTTFDSAATPKVGAPTRRRPVTMAEIDADAIQAALADVIERADADDPKTLHAEIARLRRELAKGATPAAPTVIEVPVPFLDPKILDQIRSVATSADDRAEKMLGDLGTLLMDRDRDLDNLLDEIAIRHDEQATAVGAVRRELLSTAEGTPAPAKPASTAKRVTERKVSSAPTDTSLGKCARAILTVLAQFPDGRTNTQLTTMAGYSYSGGFKNALTELRNGGYMLGANTEVMVATDAGIDALGEWEPLPSGQALLDWWLTNHLGGVERLILQHLVDHPRSQTGEDLAQSIINPATGEPYQYSGGFKNALTKLRKLYLIEGGNTTGMRLHPDFAAAIA